MFGLCELQSRMRILNLHVVDRPPVCAEKALSRYITKNVRPYISPVHVPVCLEEHHLKSTGILTNNQINDLRLMIPDL